MSDVEAVARALCAKRHNVPPHRVSEADWRAWEPEAEAAIAALQGVDEPNKDYVDRLLVRADTYAGVPAANALISELAKVIRQMRSHAPSPQPEGR